MSSVKMQDKKENYNLDVKSFEISNKGEFIIIASTDSVDRVNDIVIQEGIKAEFPMNLLLEHLRMLRIGNLYSGSVATIDNKKCFVIKGRLFLNNESEYVKQQDINMIYSNLKSGGGYFSIGYNILKSHMEGDIQILDEIKLSEVSYVAEPANLDTKVLQIKSNNNDQIYYKSMIDEYKIQNNNLESLYKIFQEMQTVKNTSSMVGCVKNILQINNESQLLSNSNKKIKEFMSYIRDFEKRCSNKLPIDIKNNTNNEELVLNDDITNDSKKSLVLDDPLIRALGLLK